MTKYRSSTLITSRFSNGNVSLVLPTRFGSGNKSLATINNYFPRYYSAFSDLVTFSKEWCKQKKIEMYKKGFNAVFRDMSLMKRSDYFAERKDFVMKPISLRSLKETAGIYMITNKVNKKFYIGMSANLNRRLYNYMDVNRLDNNRSTRIHRVLREYGFENFS
jgi:hypothetical protein